MASRPGCPSCGTALREIVWGYGTIADVADAGEVVIGGCVVDVDQDGRVAVLQCPACGTRTDDAGVALAQPAPVVGVVEHPFSVGMGGAGTAPAAADREVVMTDAQQPGWSGEDFGGAVGEGSWPGRAEPYASREDALPPASAPLPDHVAPYASRDREAPPAGTSTWHDHIDPVEPPKPGPDRAAAPDAAREAADTGTSDVTDAEEEGWPPSRSD
ncbi:hypothetical protein OVA14_04905 [Agrococcus sp. SL85]|uniref:hypothetical protein n=1 Tax=Agrococcus sp. SL85 TaxID=2995141 RepID=UPI00226CC3FC|nr:hypothetical protein [Agrococcus sp. SL85]WAC67093.1 hypothetical protein OVA14_04905 [Agrococcus sp. SL85]